MSATQKTADQVMQLMAAAKREGAAEALGANADHLREAQLDTDWCLAALLFPDEARPYGRPPSPNERTAMTRRIAALAAAAALAILPAGIAHAGPSMGGAAHPVHAVHSGPQMSGPQMS